MKWKEDGMRMEGEEKERERRIGEKKGRGGNMIEREEWKRRSKGGEKRGERRREDESGGEGKGKKGGRKGGK